MFSPHVNLYFIIIIIIIIIIIYYFYYFKKNYQNMGQNLGSNSNGGDYNTRV